MARVWEAAVSVLVREVLEQIQRGGTSLTQRS